MFMSGDVVWQVDEHFGGILRRAARRDPGRDRRVYCRGVAVRAALPTLRALTPTGLILALERLVPRCETVTSTEVIYS